MSRASRGKIRGKGTADGDDGQEISEEKKKLLSDIRALKLLIFQTENSLRTRTFENVCKAQIDYVEETSQGRFNKLVDVEAIIKNELCTYAGLSCKKIGEEEFVFAFQSFKKNLCSNRNWIQLVKVDEIWQLGRWVTPITVDVKAIIDKYSIDSAATMKLFLRDCKHQIDCYYQREQEFKELEAFLEGSKRNGHSVERNYGYTRTIIKLAKARCTSPDEARIIHLYLIYKKNEARPWKLLFECDGEKKLSENETKDLRTLFKSVKEENLKDAVEKALASDESPFVWKRASDDNSIDGDEEKDEEEDEMNLSKLLKKKPKPLKKRGKAASKTDENHNEVNEDDDGRNNDLSIDAADRSSEEDSSPVDASTPGKKKSKAARKSPKKKSLQKSKVNPKANDKSKTSRALGKKGSILKLRNDDESNIVRALQDNEREKTSKNDRATGPIVPEMFKPRNRQSTRVSEFNKEAEVPPRKSAERVNKEAEVRPRKPAERVNKEAEVRPRKSAERVNKEAKTPPRKPVERVYKIGIPGGMSTSRSHNQLACSTPIAEGTVHLSKVAGENISAIVSENTITATEIATTERNKKANAIEDLDESDSAESDDKDATTVENGQRELLKELQAVRYKVTATKKTAKRKAKSPLNGKKKTART